MTYQEFINGILSARGRFACGEEYHERHHINPRCMGGGNEEENLIDLYPQEHYEAHRLLYEENPNNSDLALAWHFVSCHEGIRISADEFTKLRIAHSKAASEYSSQRTLSEEARQKISKAKKGKFCGENNAFYGKHHSAEVRERMSKVRIGQTKGKHWYNNGILSTMAYDCPDGFTNGRLPYSEGTREKYSQSAASRFWFNDGEHEVFAVSCPDGYKKGRLNTLRNSDGTFMKEVV